MLRFDLMDDVHLRLFEERDVSELHTCIVANRERLAPWLPWARRDQADTLAYIRDGRRMLAADEGLLTAIVVDGRIAGAVGCQVTAREHGIAAVGYWLDAAVQGRGIVGRAVAAHLDHAFATWDLGRIELHTATGNAPSRAVAERLGFTFEGVLRDAHRVDGAVQDIALYAILAGEWPTRRALSAAAAP